MNCLIAWLKYSLGRYNKPFAAIPMIFCIIHCNFTIFHSCSLQFAIRRFLINAFVGWVSVAPATVGANALKWKYTNDIKVIRNYTIGWKRWRYEKRYNRERDGGKNNRKMEKPTDVSRNCWLHVGNKRI